MTCESIDVRRSTYRCRVRATSRSRASNCSMAAAVHGLSGRTPTSGEADTARIVNQVLRWRGLSRARSIQGGGTRTATRTDAQRSYSSADRMTHQIHVEGPGRTPERQERHCSKARVTGSITGRPLKRRLAGLISTRPGLPPTGERLAHELSERHPEYRRDGFVARAVPDVITPNSVKLDGQRNRNRGCDGRLRVKRPSTGGRSC